MVPSTYNMDRRFGDDIPSTTYNFLINVAIERLPSKQLDNVLVSHLSTTNFTEVL